MVKKLPDTERAASHGSVRIKLPDPRDLVQVIQLAVPHARSKEDEAAFLRIADFLDDMGIGPVSTPSGERQTLRQFVDVYISSKRSPASKWNGTEKGRAVRRQADQTRGI
jgi:hypothetical protein